MSDKVYRIFKKGTLCYRCGTTKVEVRKYGYGCSSWGAHYEKHLWNKEKTEIEVQVFK